MKVLATRHAIDSGSSLTISGGETPSITGNSIYLSDSTGNISVFLKNTGDSTDLSVTYEVGYIAPNDDEKTEIFLTPEDGGLVSTLQNADTTIVPAKDNFTIHASESLAVGNYKFTVTNNDSVDTAIVTLIIQMQNED
jgi:hypothetical protein